MLLLIIDFIKQKRNFASYLKNYSHKKKFFLKQGFDILILSPTVAYGILQKTKIWHPLYFGHLYATSKIKLYFLLCQLYFYS